MTSNKKLVIDLDTTISITKNGDYKNSVPVMPVIEKMREYKELGYEIVIFSSRNMRTYNGDIGKINVHTLPIILDFLEKYNIPHDEVIVGKPWCGFGGMYVDDRAIRPSEFIKMTENDLQSLLSQEESFVKAHDSEQIL
jgi:capsule biosynthesis phosphatase